MTNTNITFGSLIYSNPEYNDTNGWRSFDRYPRQVADVNGDNRADIVGFASDGVYVALGNSDGTFRSPIYSNPEYNDTNGWRSFDRYPRQVADVNGDNRADIVGFASDGVYVALGNSDGTFRSPIYSNPEYNDTNGWTSFDRFPRQVADVNGDNRADIVGFASNGVYVALGNSDGTFRSPIYSNPEYNDTNGWTSFDRYPRQVADVNGDNRADIVGFASNGVYVALGNSDGTFRNPIFTNPGYNDTNGWTSFDRFPRQVADVNGDNRADIVGFGDNAVSVALGKSDGTFRNPIFTNPGYNDRNGWTSFDRYPRQVGDVNGDNRADIVGFASNGVYVALARINTPTPTTPSLSINDVTLFEGNSGTTNARFTVTLTGRATNPVSVLYSTSNGTARSGSDFISKAGRLNFRASNQTRQTQTITIPVRGDRTFEGNETFFVGLSNATNAQIRDNRGTGTIRNDDNRNNRLSFGNSVNYMGEVFEDIKDVWRSSRNSVSVPYFQDDLFGSIAVDSNFI